MYQVTQGSVALLPADADRESWVVRRAVEVKRERAAGVAAWGAEKRQVALEILATRTRFNELLAKMPHPNYYLEAQLAYKYFHKLVHGEDAQEARTEDAEAEAEVFDGDTNGDADGDAAMSESQSPEGPIAASPSDDASPSDIDMDNGAPADSDGSATRSKDLLAALIGIGNTDRMTIPDDERHELNKLTRDAQNARWKYQYERPRSRHNSRHLLPASWNGVPYVHTISPAERPFLIDLISAPEMFGTPRSFPRYVRYGPCVEPGWNGSAKTHILVIPVGPESLHAIIPSMTNELIVSVRLESNSCRNVIIVSNSAALKSVTVILSSVATLGRGKNMSVLRSILRDVLETLRYKGEITIVKDAVIPTEWFGVETELDSDAYLFSLVKSLVTERTAMGFTAKITDKKTYMAKSKLSEAEFALQRGD
jgi:hypothetical protein